MSKQGHRLLFVCEGCGKSHFPFGQELFDLPVLSIPVICPFCKVKTIYDWHTSEIKSEIIKKELNLSSPPNTDTKFLEQRLTTIEANREADRAEILS